MDDPEPRCRWCDLPAWVYCDRCKAPLCVKHQTYSGTRTEIVTRDGQTATETLMITLCPEHAPGDA